MMKRDAFRRAALAMAGSGLLVAAAAAAPVDDTRLAHAAAEPENWLSFGHNYTNQRYSGLSQINRANVGRLKPRWTFRSGAKGPFQVQPLVADGVMYVTLPGNDVVALDAATGSERWRYQHVNRHAEIQGSPANRGAALGYGKVFEATNDGRLIALDAATGALAWERIIATPAPGELDGLTPEAQAALRNTSTSCRRKCRHSSTAAR